MVSDFLSELKGKPSLALLFSRQPVHSCFLFVLLGIRRETWKTKLQHPFTRMSLVPESQFQLMLGDDLRSPSMFAVLIKERFLEVSHPFMVELILVS